MRSPLPTKRFPLPALAMLIFGVTAFSGRGVANWLVLSGCVIGFVGTVADIGWLCVKNHFGAGRIEH
jgi:hypothetical protein